MNRSDHYIRYVDRLSTAASMASSWIYLFIGLIVFYEVIMRYFFNAPTYWVEELSRIGMVWSTFMIFAACLSERRLITITLARNNVGENGKAVFELVSYVAIAILSLIVVWFGIEAMAAVIRTGRATATPLSVPYWLFYLPLCIGFLLLLIQSTAESLYIIVTRQRRKAELSEEA